jgi:hypothetical protein
VELFHDLFEKLQQPLFLVLNKVLVECRSSNPTASSSSEGSPSRGSESAATVVDDAPEGAAGACARMDSDPMPLFLPEEKCVASQVVGEILTALCIVCSSLLRQVVLGNPLPPLSPLGSSSAAAAAAAAAGAGSSGSAAERAALPRTAEQRTTTPRSGSPVHGAGVKGAAPVLGSCWWEHNTLFLLIDGVVNSPDLFTIQSFGDVLKLVLDLEKAPSISVKNDNFRFLSAFYDSYLAFLLVPMLDGHDPACPVPAAFYANLGILPHFACSASPNSGNAADSNSSSSSAAQPACAVQTSRRLIFETLVQCVSSHSHRFKYFAMRNSVLTKLLSKSFQHPNRREEAWLHLLGVKLVKAVLNAKDEFYFKHLERLDLLRNMMLMFKEIAHKDNLVTACFLDVIEDIRALGIKNLVLYIVDKYADCFGKTHLPQAVFERLKVKYDQIKDRTLHPEDEGRDGAWGPGGAGRQNKYLTGVRGRQQRVYSDMDSEEDYFFGEDDNSSQESRGSKEGHRDKRQRTAGGGSNSSGLVPSGMAASAIERIVHGAFEGAEPPASMMTSQNMSSLQRASAAAGDHGRSLQRTNSLGRSGSVSSAPESNPHEAASVSGSQVSSAHSKSTTAGLRGSLMAMLGAYGIDDAEDEDDGPGGARTGAAAGGADRTALTKRNIAQMAETSSSAGAGRAQNIYDEDDGVSELSDNTSMSGDEGEGWERARAGSIDSAGGDPYAGADFVRASHAARSPHGSPKNGARKGHTSHTHGQPAQQGLAQEQGAAAAVEGRGSENEPEEAPLPLPPLKSRFQYDDDEQETAFLAALSAAQQQQGHGSVSGTTSVGGSGHGNGSLSCKTTTASGHISFSLKKKPVS